MRSCNPCIVLTKQILACFLCAAATRLSALCTWNHDYHTILLLISTGSDKLFDGCHHTVQDFDAEDTNIPPDLFNQSAQDFTVVPDESVGSSGIL
jgi:hypothetical protein